MINIKDKIETIFLVIILLINSSIITAQEPKSPQKETQKGFVAEEAFGLHLHVPDTAQPKDGPSAGGASTASIISQITGVPICNDVAMTGEIDLTREINAIAGIEDKAGVREVSAPLQNGKDPKIPQKETQKGFISVDFLSIKMPLDRFGNQEPNMDFTGVHYNLIFNDFYTGVGIYGAVGGIHGGFFTLGVNAGYEKFLSKKLFLDAGFHFGGGGGANALDGGGAFILPHLNLGYQFKNFNITVGYSYINFFDGGQIKSPQLNVALQIPLSFDYANHTQATQAFTCSELQDSDWNQPSSNISAMVHFNNLKVQSTSRAILDKKIIQLAGFELSTYQKNVLYFFKVDGAYNGIKAGYMDVLGGAGYQWSLHNNSTKLLAKFGIGAGGGGGVDTNGGFLISPDISLEQRIFKALYLSINKGYLMTPNAKFKTSTFGIGLKYYANLGGAIEKEKQCLTGTFKGFEAIIKEDIYLNAQRDVNLTENLYQISLQLNFNLSQHFFLAGETSFANFGNAGAYAEGLLGFGFNSGRFFNKKAQLFTQFLGGAAGGGGISTGQGFIIKPSVGLDYKLSKSFSLRTATGIVKAVNGKLTSPLFTMGINYKLAFLSLH